MTITRIPDDNLRAFAEDIQWAERNFWKDIGFSRSAENRDDMRKEHAADITGIISGYELLNGTRGCGNNIGDLLFNIEMELLELNCSAPDHATFADNVKKLMEKFKNEAT